MITKIEGVITSILGFDLKLPIYFVFIERLKMLSGTFRGCEA